MKVIVILVNLIFIFSVMYWYSKRTRTLQVVFWPALLFKLTSGIALGLLYTYYYDKHGADTFIFFEDGVTLSKFARANLREYITFLWNGDDSYAIWEKLNVHQYRALFIAKIVSVVNLLTADNYWITSLYFSVVSFICSWRLVLTICAHFPMHKTAAIVSFLILPSVVFWSSGVMKETLALACLFFLTHVFLNLWMQKKNSIATYLLSILSFWILWQVKYYYVAVFAPVLTTSLVLKFIILPLLRIRKPGYEIALWFVVFILSVFIFSLTRSNLHVENVASVIVKNQNTVQHFSKPAGTISFWNLEATGFSIAMNMPWALFSGLFRPFIWEATNVFQVMLSIENLVVLFFFIMALRNYKDALQSTNRLLILSVLVYATLLCMFLTLSTPNFGTLSRYRVGFLPFFFFLIACENSIIAYFSKFNQRKNSRLVR